MLIIVLAFLGGALTILSPCILPVLPFVFARAGQPFRRNGLPLLAGMGLTFTVVATLAAIGGGWVAHANQYGRWLAIALLAVFGLTLLLPSLAEHLTRPFVSLGNRLSNAAQRDGGGATAGGSFVLGIATGLVWAPCAGPILGLILTGAALRGASASTTLLLLAYAVGAGCSLALALLIGGRVFKAMKRSLGAGEWVRRGIGAAMLLGVLAISLGWDTGVLASVSTVSTGGLEQSLVNRLSAHGDGNAAKQVAATGTPTIASGAMMAVSQNTPAALPVEGVIPPLSGAVQWLNSPPLTPESLRGKVVLIDFWTYSCINCLRTLPYVKAWAEKYKDQGLVVIGVHAPEFAFERNIDNVKKAVHDLGITFPVAIDNNYAIWRALDNQYWPADYFVDAKGQIRAHHFGEGDYAGSEKVIQQLLAEAGDKNVSKMAIGVNDDKMQGVQAAADDADIRSPETYIGFQRAQNFASPGGQHGNSLYHYTAPLSPNLNEWGLDGVWNVGGESAVLASAPGRITFRFHARDLHLVLGPDKDGKPIRFKVRIDGNAPGANHGSDTTADGSGVVTEQRLYQLVRQTGKVEDHTFTIEFLDPGVQAYSFTFG